MTFRENYVLGMRPEFNLLND